MRYSRIVRGGLPWLATGLGLLAASLSLSLWLAAAALEHNTGLLDSVSGALSTSSLVSSGLGTNLTPQQQAQASSALSQALDDPSVQAAVAAGQGQADGALDAQLRSSDPTLASQVAAHPVPLSTLRRMVSDLPSRLRSYSDWSAIAALTLVGAAFSAGAKRERVLRRAARWALSTGGLGLVFGMLVPYAAGHVLHGGEVARLARGLAAGTSDSAGGLFAALVAAGALGLVACRRWRRAPLEEVLRAPATVSP